MRVRRTFGFIDVSGFTALTESHGDPGAVAVLTTFRAAVREICSRRGVRIAKWLGDGAMLVGVETAPVIGAALELQRYRGTDHEPIAVRSGLSTGAVLLLEGDDYVGHDVNVAARLCDGAAGREVLATEDVLSDLPAWAAVLSIDPLLIRGIEHPVPVASLGLPPPTHRASADPVCGISLDPDVALYARCDPSGATQLFCSDSCLEGWEWPIQPATGATPALS